MAAPYGMTPGVVQVSGHMMPGQYYHGKKMKGRKFKGGKKGRIYVNVGHGGGYGYGRKFKGGKRRKYKGRKYK